MLGIYFKTATRNLIKDRSASFINITGLSLGMAAAILILLWVKNELNFDNYHPHAANIYYTDLGTPDGTQHFGGTPYPMADAISKQVPGVEATTHFIVGGGFSQPVLRINNRLFREKSMAYIPANWFDFFHYEFIGEDNAAFAANPHGIVLTASLAKKYFGTQAAIGEIIQVDSMPFRVEAVVKDNPSNSSFQYNIFLPEDVYLTKNKGVAAQWKFFPVQTFIRLKENASVPAVRQGISSIVEHNVHNKEAVNDNPFARPAGFITPLKDIHFTNNMFSHGADKKMVTIFSVLGLLLLTIACINYVNLSTARASKRSKEVSIKKMMGANVKTLFVQFMTESLLTSSLALLLTLVLITLALPWFNTLTGKTFTLSFTSMGLWQVLGGTLLITLLLTGIYPAFLLSSFKPLNVLRGNNVLKLKDSGLRKTLVTTQFTIAIALTVCTIVILQQIHFIRNTNEGYNRSQIFSFSLPNALMSSGYMNDKTELVNSLKAALSKETAIVHTTASNESIQDIIMAIGGITDWQGKKQGNDPAIALVPADADFKDMFKLQLVEGRWYDARNQTDRHNYILTETTVRELGLQKPVLGQYFSVFGDTGRIIGIVKDFHFRNFREKISAAVLLGNPTMKGTFFVEAAPQKIKQALARTEAVFKQHFPQQPFEYAFMDAAFDDMYRTDTKTATLVSLFAGTAIFISCLGLLGLVSFVAEQKTKEIGIRKILGATVSNIAGLLSKDFLKLVLLAIVVASPLAWWAASKWLQEFAYRINISWWMFAAAGAAAILLALLTVSIQAIKAALANPVKSLRAE